MQQASSHAGKISCFNCRYYLVTWDVRFPHGCRAHVFKTRKSPALDVYQASGMECLLFAAKKPGSAPQAVAG